MNHKHRSVREEVRSVRAPSAATRSVRELLQPRKKAREVAGEVGRVCPKERPGVRLQPTPAPPHPAGCLLRGAPSVDECARSVEGNQTKYIRRSARDMVRASGPMVMERRSSDPQFTAQPLHTPNGRPGAEDKNHGQPDHRIHGLTNLDPPSQSLQRIHIEHGRNDSRKGLHPPFHRMDPLDQDFRERKEVRGLVRGHKEARGRADRFPHDPDLPPGFPRPNARETKDRPCDPPTWEDFGHQIEPLSQSPIQIPFERPPLSHQ